MLVYTVYISIYIYIYIESSEAFAERAKLNFQLKKYEMAIYDYSVAISLEVSDGKDGKAAAPYYNMKGECQRKLEQLVDAEQSFSKAITLDKHKDIYYINKAKVLALQKFYKKAISLYSTALEMNTDQDNRFSIYFSRGICYSEIEDTDHAIADLKQANTLKNGTDPDTLDHLGMAYVDAGKYELALDHLNKAIYYAKDSPKKAQYHHNRGMYIYIYIYIYITRASKLPFGRDGGGEE